MDPAFDKSKSAIKEFFFPKELYEKYHNTFSCLYADGKVNCMITVT